MMDASMHDEVREAIKNPSTDDPTTSLSRL